MAEEALSENRSENRQRTLLLYALLTGLTPLIPVPFADDLAKGHLRRRLVHLLAQAHDLNLSGNTVEALAREPGGGGCLLGGCLGQVLLYPLKKIFRKVFFFLEWKRTIDLTSHTYHWGYLLDYAFQEGLVELPGSGQNNPRVDDLRTAIEKACQDVPLQPVERAVSATLRQSRAVLLSAANKIGMRLRGVATGRAEEQQAVSEAMGPMGPAQNEQVRGVAALLQQRIASMVPEEHFHQLRQRFRTHLAHLAQEGTEAREQAP
jgi:hypothetical protein